MTQTHSTDLEVLTSTSTPASSKAKRFAQMAGAAALSVGLVGTFSLPAYATEQATAATAADFANSQSGVSQALTTSEAGSAPLAGSSVSGSDKEAVAAEKAAEKKAEQEAKEAAEAAKNAEAADEGPAAPSGKDVPAGAGAKGIVNAALAQIGDIQDCTALVERSLRAIGVPAGDLGTQIGEYTALGGTLVTSGDYAPGDVLIWSGRHVAVYIGNGQAVHGGYGGDQTVVAGAFIDGAPSGVVRFG